MKKYKLTYQKTPFQEWKQNKADWQFQICGHKVLCKQIGFAGKLYYSEILILDYEPDNDIFYLHYIKEDKKIWNKFDERDILFILDEVVDVVPNPETNTKESSSQIANFYRELSERINKSNEADRRRHHELLWPKLPLWQITCLKKELAFMGQMQ